MAQALESGQGHPAVPGPGSGLARFLTPPVYFEWARRARSLQTHSTRQVMN